METISIIVPVYKVEQYLDRCVSSLVNQTYKNLEIILVDDGSPDNCGKMCDEWAEKDNRIKVVHKENAGAGYARNSGIDAATGKYVMFVDSDDYILDNACEIAVQGIVEHKAQICCFGHIDDFNGTKVISTEKNEKSEYSDNEVIDGFLSETLSQGEETTMFPFVVMSAWNAIYNLSVIKDNNIRFMSERNLLNEDLFFKVKICEHINKVVVLPKHLYVYCHKGESVSTSYKEDRFECSLVMYNLLVEELSSYMDRADIANKCKRAFMNNIIVCLKQEVVCFKSKGIKNLRKKYKQIVDDEIVAEVMRSYPIKKLPKQQRVLFEAIKYKNIAAIFILVKIKDLINRKKI